ncbi:MAG: hypothetical protein M0R77_15005 [Gammaproteobacteria bacterium]|nr:hypothetical protein [Gammaproteobacteria bacterium]
MEKNVTSEYEIGINDSNVQIMKSGYREYLTPKTKKPIYQIGIIAKIVTSSRRYGRAQDLYVSFWATLGPNSDNLVFEKVGIPSYKANSKMKSFSKKFPKENIGELVALRGVDINEYFSAYHSYLIITDWYSEQTEKLY